MSNGYITGFVALKYGYLEWIWMKRYDKFSTFSKGREDKNGPKRL